MKDEIVKYETAVLAKEKGFNIPVLYSYGLEGENTLSPTDDNSLFDLNTNGEHGYSAPTQSLLQKWLREVHGIYVFVYMDEILWDSFRFNVLMNDQMVYDERTIMFDTYEEALEAGLSEGLKLIK